MWHSQYKPITSRGRIIVAHKKLRYFSITFRLQRLFMSPKTTEHMTLHQSHDMVDGVLMHPFDSEDWKNFNSMHPQFSVESRNVYLGLCIDGLNPFGSFVAPYSCWSIILIIYNLPLGMCMRLELIFFIYGYT